MNQPVPRGELEKRFAKESGLMKNAVTLTLILALLFLAVAGTQLVKKARAETITVPDDYPTIQDAINTANDGDIIFVRSGIYEGPINETLVISKPLSLIGEDVNRTKLSLHPPLVPMSIFTYTYMGYSEPIRIAASDVKLSGFTITTVGGGISATGNGTQITGNILNMGVSATGNRTKIIGNIMNQGSGISISGDNNVIAQNSVLAGWNSFISCTGSFNFIEGNSIVGSTSSESLDLDGSFNVIYGNTLTDCGSIAVGAPPVSVECEGNIIAKNNLTNSGGIYIRGSSNVICANRIANGGAALEVTMGDNNTFYANHIVNNTFGARVGFDQTDISRQSGPRVAQNTLYHNNFISNTQQAIDWNWLGTNSWDNGREGNYWSDYNSADWNFDGIGDVSYTLSEAISFYAPSTQGADRYPLMAPFDIDSVTVELPEWAYAALSPEPTTSPTPTPSQEPTATPETQQPQLFPTALVIALVITIIVEGIGLIIYFKKRKR
jgi:nitrous oxidase accessory protein